MEACTKHNNVVIIYLSKFQVEEDKSSDGYERIGENYAKRRSPNSEADDLNP